MSHDDVDIHSEFEPDAIRTLIDNLRGLIELKEGELYTFRKGLFHHVPPREDNGLRRIRVMEEAYDAACEAARQLRKTMRGYRPDPALVISAWVMHTARQPEAKDIARAYLQSLFTAEADNRTA